MSITKQIFNLDKSDVIWLYKLILRKEKYSNFIDRNLDSQIQCLVNESKELLEAIQLWDNTEAKKELCDIIYLTLLVTSWMINSWILKEWELWIILKEHQDKIYKRSPQLLYQKKESISEEERLRKVGKSI